MVNAHIVYIVILHSRSFLIYFVIIIYFLTKYFIDIIIFLGSLNITLHLIYLCADRIIYAEIILNIFIFRYVCNPLRILLVFKGLVLGYVCLYI
jgi:hypothetical protein